MNNRVRLRINAERLGDIREVIRYLTIFEQAYNHLYAFDFILQRAKEDSHIEDYNRDNDVLRKFGHRPARNLITIRHPDKIVLPEDRLRISRVVVESPGFWEFLGSLNPLEVLRKYLCDRHERKKDTAYRNRQEKEKGELELAKLGLEVVGEEISILQSLGVPEEKIRKAQFDHVDKPLRALDEVQDKGLAQDAHFLSPNTNHQFVDDAED